MKSRDGEASMKSRAAVLFEPNTKLEICDVDLSEPKRGEVCVQLKAAGVCHTDYSVMKGLLNAPLPAILGHEGAGIVVAIGEGVSNIKVGDHVIPLWRLSCGECELCKKRRPALCSVGSEIRSSGRMSDGQSRFRFKEKEIFHFAGVSSFSNFTVIPEGAVLKIPKDIPFELAALIGCSVITGVGSVMNAADVSSDSSIAVFGAGGVGVNVIQGAVLAGAKEIIAIDQFDSRLEQAKAFGATKLINSKINDPVSMIREITDQKGVDFAFEAVGLSVTIQQAFDSLAKTGKAIVIGIPSNDTHISISAVPLVFEERTITGSLYGSAAPKLDIPNMIKLYEDGKLNLDSLLTDRYPLEEINEAYDAMIKGKSLRSVIVF